jgi:hypothetical protein
MPESVEMPAPVRTVILDTPFAQAGRSASVTPPSLPPDGFARKPAAVGSV